MALGALLAGLVLIQWLGSSGGNLLQRTLFQVGVLLGLLGAQLIGFGLVGEIIVFTQARNLREYRIERTFEPHPRDGDGDDSGDGPIPRADERE
jgi:hypothetical protein